MAPRKMNVGGKRVLAYNVPAAAMAYMRKAFPDLCKKLGMKEVRVWLWDRAGLLNKDNDRHVGNRTHAGPALTI